MCGYIIPCQMLFLSLDRSILFFLSLKYFLNISCKADLQVINFFHDWFLIKSLFSPSLSNSNFTGYRILGWWSFSFRHLKYSILLYSCLHDLMDNFIIQLGCITISKYVVRYSSGYFCEGIFWMILTFKSMTLSKADCLPQCVWTSPILWKDWSSLRKSKLCQEMVSRPEPKWSIISSVVWSLTAHSEDFGLANLCNRMNQFLKINTFLFYTYSIDSISL